ncbi:uncharacterized protein LOC130732141 [Lotus japonicus]|uniref:uncharacterized protein LOC130732141 n=1 Tax=Lotus japonicus TaxID=34305 RepID=UPI0025838498|nr:uncharacterized protein LOC130732141 [Lotus japonicus]
MRNRKVTILFLWAMLALCTILELKVQVRASSPLESEIEAKLKLLNKPAVKTIKSEDGDIIDCIDIYKQPAFDHPVLKNHTIQSIPSFLLESQNSSTKDTFQAETNVFQTWQKSGSCPKGTVPIRRIRREDLLRFDSLDSFGQKPRASFMNSTKTLSSHFPKLNGSKVVIPENHSASYLVTVGYHYIGAQADINIWNPRVDLPEDFTTAQIWLKTGNGPNFESVEAGWVVNPKLFGDRATRFFNYWTKDSYLSTGCFDVTCPGFVVTGQVALGGAIKPVSSTRGTQYDLTVGMFLDPITKNWWLKVKNNIVVGYWPAILFDELTQSATIVEWGGQVFSPMVKQTPHTKTGMGSGDFANGLFGNACYMRNIRIKDYSLKLKYPEFVRPVTEEQYCYNVLNDVKYGKEPYFYFGGPGQRPPYCP